MAEGSKSPTPGGDKGAKLNGAMPNGQTRMKPASPKAPALPVRH